jgi:hypothetical protein
MYKQGAVVRASEVLGAHLFDVLVQPLVSPQVARGRCDGRQIDVDSQWRDKSGPCVIEGHYAIAMQCDAMPSFQ